MTARYPKALRVLGAALKKAGRRSGGVDDALSLTGNPFAGMSLTAVMQTLQQYCRLSLALQRCPLCRRSSIVSRGASDTVIIFTRKVPSAPLLQSNADTMSLLSLSTSSAIACALAGPATSSRCAAFRTKRQNV